MFDLVSTLIGCHHLVDDVITLVDRWCVNFDWLIDDVIVLWLINDASTLIDWSMMWLYFCWLMMCQLWSIDRWCDFFDDGRWCVNFDWLIDDVITTCRKIYFARRLCRVLFSDESGLLMLIYLRLCCSDISVFFRHFCFEMYQFLDIFAYQFFLDKSVFLDIFVLRRISF